MPLSCKKREIPLSVRWTLGNSETGETFSTPTHTPPTASCSPRWLPFVSLSAHATNNLSFARQMYIEMWNSLSAGRKVLKGMPAAPEAKAFICVYNVWAIKILEAVSEGCHGCVDALELKMFLQQHKTKISWFFYALCVEGARLLKLLGGSSCCKNLLSENPHNACLDYIHIHIFVLVFAACVCVGKRKVEINIKQATPATYT